MPFSDPLADGPVIHAAGVAALAAACTSPTRSSSVRAIADEVPVVVMCYANLVLARGLERFVDMLVEVGASGLIVPDLPLEEAPATLEACDQRGAGAGAAGGADDPRRAPRDRSAPRARGFLYTVSVTGTTGERATMTAGSRRDRPRPRAHRGARWRSASGSARPSRQPPPPRPGRTG